MTGPEQPFGNPDGVQHPPWQNPGPPGDPHGPVAYPEYPDGYPPPPPGGPYGYPPPYPGGHVDYGGWPAYPPQPDPYRFGRARTNGLAIGSLATSIAGVFLGIPLVFACYVGALIPIVAIVLGAVALNQVKRTNEQGRGLAVAGIAVGAVTLVLQALVVLFVFAAAVHGLP